MVRAGRKRSAPCSRRRKRAPASSPRDRYGFGGVRRRDGRAQGTAGRGERERKCSALRCRAICQITGQQVERQVGETLSKTENGDGQLRISKIFNWPFHSLYPFRLN